jgi:hypothetical protein
LSSSNQHSANFDNSAEHSALDYIREPKVSKGSHLRRGAGQLPNAKGCLLGYNLSMPVFEEKHEELEHFETMMGVPRGRLAVTMDTITDAMALVGQHGVYCQSQRWPGRPVLDIQIVMKSLTDAKELIQSVMEELKKQPQASSS